MYSIYVLKDPRTNEVKYVGITKDLYRRFKEHISTQNSNHLRDKWIKELQGEGVIPSAQTLEVVETKEDAHSREQYWIQYYAQQGARLTNIQHHSLPVTKKIGSSEFACTWEEMLADGYWS